MSDLQQHGGIAAPEPVLRTTVKVPAALFKPALVLMSGRALGFVAVFGVPLILVRLFSPHEFGTYKQLFLLYSTLFGIMQIGMAESLYYFLPGEPIQRGSYIINVMLALSLLGALVQSLFTWQGDRIAALLNNSDLQPYLPLVGTYLLLMLASLVAEIVMTARKQHIVASCTYALTDLSRVMFFLVPVLVYTAGLRGLLQGAVVFAGGRLLATLGYLRQEFGEQLRFDRKLLVRQLGYALPFGLAGLIEMVQANFHLYVVSWYFDAATFAIYSVGCLQLPVTDFLMTSISSVMMVNMREQLHAGNIEAVRAIWSDAVHKLSLVLFPMVGVLLALAHELIVTLFTPTYERSVTVFIVWTFSMLPLTLLTDGLLRVYAQNRFLIFQNFLRLVLIAVLIRAFLHYFGLAGGVLVSLFAAGVTRMLSLMRAQVLLRVNLAHLLPWKRLLVSLSTAAAAMLPVLLVKTIFPGVGLVHLFLGGCVYLLTYCALLWHFEPLFKELIKGGRSSCAA